LIELIFKAKTKGLIIST